MSVTCLSLHLQTPCHNNGIFVWGDVVLVAAGGEHRDKQNTGRAFSVDVT